MEPTTPRPKLTREQALEKYGDVRCALTEFNKGDIVFEGQRTGSGRRLLADPDGREDGLWAAVRLTLRAGDYDPGDVSYDQSDVFTMREDESNCHVRIFEGNEVVYEAEPRGVEFAVDDEDPDGEP